MNWQLEVCTTWAQKSLKTVALGDETVAVPTVVGEALGSLMNRMEAGEVLVKLIL